MKFYSYLFILLNFLLFSCDSEEEKKADIYSIKRIGMLSTTEYTVGKVIKLNDEPEWYKFGDRKILISCKAKIKAGVNLMQCKIFEEEGKTVIEIPPSEIVSFEMDPNLIKTEMVDVNGLRFTFSQEDKNEALKQGEMQILKQINESNIYKEAEEKAELFIRDFYDELGVQNLEIRIKPRYETR